MRARGLADAASAPARLTALSSRSYEGTGLLRMMERNAKVKRAPERWQDALGVSRFNVVLCFQERVFDAAVEGAGVPAAAAVVAWRLTWALGAQICKIGTQSPCLRCMC